VNRSKISNGNTLLPNVDGRSTWVRRCRDIIEAHLADLGGTLNTSEAERSIIRRAATLTTELERLEVKFALSAGATADDLDLYQRTAGNLRRLLEAIGLRRRPREVEVPNLTDYLAAARPCQSAVEPGEPDTDIGLAEALPTGLDDLLNVEAAEEAAGRTGHGDDDAPGTLPTGAAKAARHSPAGASARAGATREPTSSRRTHPRGRYATHALGSARTGGTGHEGLVRPRAVLAGPCAPPLRLGCADCRGHAG
jgi:hypothetical protein